MPTRTLRLDIRNVDDAVIVDEPCSEFVDDLSA